MPETMFRIDKSEYILLTPFFAGNSEEKMSESKFDIGRRKIGS